MLRLKDIAIAKALALGLAAATTAQSSEFDLANATTAERMTYH